MWSNCISIDKGEDRYIEELLLEIDGVLEVSNAVEESKNRIFIYMAGLCEKSDIILDKIENIVADYILTRYKLRFYYDRLHFFGLNFPIATLISTLIYLDYDLEKAYLKRIFNDFACYDIDGICNFRIKSLKNTWIEICEMCNRLFDVGTNEQDIYNVISYIAQTKAQKPKELTIHSENPVKIEDDGKEIKVRKLFGIDSYDIIGCVIEKSATRLNINCNIGSDMVKALSHIVRVKLK